VLIAPLLLTGCRSGPLLSNVTLKPVEISPRIGSPNQIAILHYELARNAFVSISFTGPDGQAHFFRQAERRSAGGYDAQFNGVVNERVLPDGVYTWVVEARPAEGGPPERAEGRVTITGADTALPELRDFSVFPSLFTPNQDGIDDRVTISYYLVKPAKVDVHIVGPAGQTYPVEEKKATRSPGEAGIQQPGVHQYDYDAGVDADAPPPPDGAYTVVAVARDEVGNIVRREAPLTIKEGGVPRATIVSAEIRPPVVRLGESVMITATVRNVGTTPIRTTGPPPGTEYPSNQSYNTLQFPALDGAWRLGAEYDANPTGPSYPYRWQLGDVQDLEARTGLDGRTIYYLPPGKSVTITGRIRMVEKPYRRDVHFYVGLHHEGVRKVEGEVKPTEIVIEY